MTDRVTRADIECAYDRIKSHVRATPVLELPPGAAMNNVHISLKLELLQCTGSFKPRGAFNNALLHAVPKGGVAAASGGNHGIAVAHVARTLGHHATIFVSGGASRVKIEAIKALGADIRICGNSYDDAQLACMNHVTQTGALHIHPFDDEATIAGQGTIGLEWERQSPGLDTILVAAGGGGLVSGIASWYAGQGVKVIAVEPEGANALHASMLAGVPVPVTVQSIAADSLGPKIVSARVHDICSGLLERVVLVSDSAIRAAQAHLWNNYRLVTEPGGATAFAALLSGSYVPTPGSRIGVLLCGGNADLSNITSPESQNCGG